MKKQLFIIFAILSVGFFFLFTGIFGERGLLENKSLENKINRVEYEILKLDSQIESLNRKSKELSTEEGLRESALKLGYNISGDEVYLFENSSLQKTESSQMENADAEKEFTPLSKPLILIIAIGTSLMVTMLLSLAFVRKVDSEDEDKDYMYSGEQNDSEQIQSGDNPDYLFFN